jgi:hypothetical protein
MAAPIPICTSAVADKLLLLQGQAAAVYHFTNGTASKVFIVCLHNMQRPKQNRFLAKLAQDRQRTK